MKNVHRLLRTMSAAALLATTLGNASAALFDRGGGLIYDSVLDVTWLQDADYAAKTYGSMFGSAGGYQGGGLLNASQAQAWADALSYVDSVRGVTYTDWRLPVVNARHPGPPDAPEVQYNGTDNGYNVDTSDSELASLFYTSLGRVAYYDTSGQGPQPGWSLDQNAGPFVNLASAPYLATGESGWYFNFGFGSQSRVGQFPTNGLYSVLVLRDGDVAAVPEPGGLVLMLLGLAAVAASRIASRR